LAITKLDEFIVLLWESTILQSNAMVNAMNGEGIQKVYVHELDMI
jgi:hypothetical protein